MDGILLQSDKKLFSEYHPFFIGLSKYLSDFHFQVAYQAACYQPD
jgi:hypothetical protein